MKSRIAVFLMLLTLLAAPTLTSAQTDRTDLPLAKKFALLNQAGVRLGVWAHQGSDPPEVDTINNDFKTRFSSENFYFELFYGHRLSSILMLEGSLGIVNRGSVSFRVANRDNVGNVTVYSVLAQAKIYPFGSAGWRLQPYVTGGGGLYYGRRSVQFTTSYYYYPGLDDETATNFNYTIGGGVDYPLASQVGLDFNIKYAPANFGSPLMTVKDYSALAFSIGVKYLYSRSKNK